ncbi:MAG: hypothetical protein KC431_18580, partial [Myxococcales bacterium]|nr:hypothetical protein [Myxococcales bacterium]
RHRGEDRSDREIVEDIVADNLHGIDLDPEAVRIAAISLWLAAKRVAPTARLRRVNLVASQRGSAGPADHLGSLLRLDALPEREQTLDTSADRFRRLLQEGRYHLVVSNPPYQGTSKLADPSYVNRHYPRSRADLFAAFLERGLELARPGGLSAMLTLRNWMFIKQYA